MKYLKVFGDKSALDTSVNSIQHGDGAFVFGVKTTIGIEDITIYDQRHPGGNCPAVYNAYPVNMLPVKLDLSSTRKTPNVADYLFSTVDGKLTLDRQTEGVENTPIAICVIPYIWENFSKGDESTGTIKAARFVSLNYMNHSTPTTGSISAQKMRFGNYNVTIGNVKGDPNAGSYVGGKWNTQKCLHACTNENKDLTNGVTNASRPGFCPPACCCVAYSTPGTKPGDWYLPMPGELYQLYENIEAISSQRSNIKEGNGFDTDLPYWCNRETTPQAECNISLKNGAISELELKSRSNNVLAFLAVALEV